jgi:hypothetical protein
VLVLWDVDNTLVDAGDLGTRLYESAFREMFGCELSAVAPKAGRTDRAITLDTLALAGVSAPGTQVDAFLASLARQVAALDGRAGSPVVALPARHKPLRPSTWPHRAPAVTGYASRCSPAISARWPNSSCAPLAWVLG